MVRLALYFVLLLVTDLTLLICILCRSLSSCSSSCIVQFVLISWLQFILHCTVCADLLAAVHLALYNLCRSLALSFADLLPVVHPVPAVHFVLHCFVQICWAVHFALYCVQISCLRFIFLINQDLINTVREDALKQGTTASAS